MSRRDTATYWTGKRDEEHHYLLLQQTGKKEGLSLYPSTHMPLTVL